MPLFGPPNIDKLKAKRDIPGLIKALTDTKHAATGSAASRALRALIELGAPEVEPLIDLLKHPHVVVRARAAVALGASGDARVVEPLVTALGDMSDISSGVRMGAARSLGQIADARAVEPLIAALADPKDVVRPLAAEALGQIGDARAVEPLIKALCSGHQARVEAAASALVKIGLPAVEPLLRALKYSDSYVRNQAATVLGQIGDARAVEALVLALKDDTGSVRRSAARALAVLYRGGSLDKHARALIGSNRAAMDADHTDRLHHIDAKDSSCWYERDEYVHTDAGIGVGLPL